MTNNNNIIISNNGITIVKSYLNIFIYWEEIDYTKFFDVYGKWLVIYTYEEKGLNISISLDLSKGIPDNVWKNVVLGKKLFNLLNEYLSDFKESTFYSNFAPIFHRMKAEIFEKKRNFIEALIEINISLVLSSKLIHPLTYLVKGRVLFELNKNKKEYLKYLILAKNCRLRKMN